MNPLWQEEAEEAEEAAAAAEEEEEEEEAPTPKRHSRHGSSNRRPMARRLTKGPLDTVDPLTLEPPPTLGKSTAEAAELPIPPSPFSPHPLSPETPAPPPLEPPRDFRFLQQPEIYHALTQLDLPLPFRSPTYQPLLSTPIPTLLASANFRSAATAAAHQICTSPSLPLVELFSLLYTRLACLTLINATALAAEESKALEDLNSPFYRDPATHAHFAPWELRVLAVRLQGIGYGDSRRGILGYYDLARDARAAIVKAASKEERAQWKARLEDLGTRVGNALVEMGDFGGAARHLESFRGKGGDAGERLLNGRLALLHLRLGNVAAARRHVQGATAMLDPLLSMAEGRFEDAVDGWKSLGEASDNELVAQNLAVCLLYTGHLDEENQKAGPILTSLIAAGHAFPALTFNLATVYELCSERAGAKKAALAEEVAATLAAGTGTGDGEVGKASWGSERGAERVNADFKL